ncbi:hypothetical protein AVEN_149211-1 [Araneus ventricosus]|uniref:Uncharacterized protein n=1 Tax=Araneus ventricosus TaxID=182803 RepID=A0A4Y2SA42_ARAVE|nr:hypothetical protein AVEN_149211-1 [Araneus ventricosus]
MRRPGSLHKTGDFDCLRAVESWTSPTLVSVRFTSNRVWQYSHQGLRVLIFTDRPGPRAHLVGVYIELRDFIDFSSAVQVGFGKFINYFDQSYSSSLRGELSEDVLLENGTSVEYWFEVLNETASNDSSISFAGELSEDVLLENGTSVEYWFEVFNETASNESSISFTWELSKEVLLENATSVEYWFEVFNETASNDSSQLDMHGFGQKVVNKGNSKTPKDKVKSGLDKAKNKTKDIKNKTGSGGTSGGGYYRDRYDRERYNRDYHRRESNYGGGSGHADPRDKWFALGLVIFMTVGILGIVLYYKYK